MSIYQKMAKVMGQINKVPKTGYNSFHGYNYVTESDLTENIRGIMAEAGLAFLPSVEQYERQGELTRVRMRFILADAETGENVESYFWGEGQDKGDKGFYKAYTGAVKYFLLKTFLVATGDDPEADTSVDQANASKSSPPREQPKSPPKQEGMNDSQRRKMFALAKELNLNETKLKELMHHYYSKSSSKELSTAEASSFLNHLMDIQKGREEMPLLPSDEAQIDQMIKKGA